MICPLCGSPNLPGRETCGNCQQDLAPCDRPVPMNRVERCLMEDPVAALKSRPPTAVMATTSVLEAVGRMIDDNVGAVLVVDELGALVGILTERDLMKKVAGEHDDYANLPVARFMTPRPEAVSPGTTLNYVLQKMDAGGYRHVPVVDGGRPLGIVSVRTMLRHIVELCKDP